MFSWIAALLPGKSWIIFLVAITGAGGVIYWQNSQINTIHEELGKAQSSADHQASLVLEWKKANDISVKAAAENAVTFEKMIEAQKQRLVDYQQSRKASQKLQEAINNASDTNHILDRFLGSGFWLPIMARAQDYNSAAALSPTPKTKTDSVDPNASTGSDQTGRYSGTYINMLQQALSDCNDDKQAYNRGIK